MHGEPPPEQLKVCVNELGGFRNTVEFVLTGLDIDAKADWVREQLEAPWPRTPPASVTWSRTSVPHADADTEEAASCLLPVHGQGPVGRRGRRAFTAAAVELALASYPGFTMTAPPAPATPYGVYRPAYVDRGEVEHTVVHADGRREVIADPEPVRRARRRRPAPVAVPRTDGLR